TSSPHHLITSSPPRDDGLDHFRRLAVDDHLAVHWGMSMAAYPFFGTVAEATGRLIRLQGSAGAAPGGVDGGLPAGRRRAILEPSMEEDWGRQGRARAVEATLDEPGPGQLLDAAARWARGRPITPTPPSIRALCGSKT